MPQEICSENGFVERGVLFKLDVEPWRHTRLRQTYKLEGCFWLPLASFYALQLAQSDMRGTLRFNQPPHSSILTPPAVAHPRITMVHNRIRHRLLDH